MANVLKREKQIQVLQLLCEGNSIRSTERITGIHRDTIMRVLVRFGTQCRRFLDLSFHSLNVQHIQCDEIWTWVYKKEGHKVGNDHRDDTIGDIYLFTALDTDSKMVFSFTLGKRNGETTRAFVQDVAKRVVRPPVDLGDVRPQVSTDGWPSYVASFEEAFNGSIRHGVIIKNYENPESGRYAPPDLCRAERISINGISDVSTICTSHVERNNLTIRTFIKRFTRLTLGFSKKLDNLAAAVALHVVHYNFCHRLRENGKSGRYRPTPAMMAGICSELWDWDRLYDEVTALARKDDMALRTERLLLAMMRKQ